MKKKIYFAVLCFLICALFLSAQDSFERESILNETLVKSFIKNHKNLFMELKKENAGEMMYPDNKESVRETFDRIWKLKPGKKIKRIFEKYRLDGNKGMYQLIVLQYGIVAYTIEEALSEITNEERSAKQKESDRRTIGWLAEIKSQIHSFDYKLIKQYGKDLYEIFNEIEKIL